MSCAVAARNASNPNVRTVSPTLRRQPRLAGTITFTVDGTDHEIGAGEVVFVPRGAVHGFVNRGDADARFLAVTTPGLLGPEYFRELREVITSAVGGPPDLGAIMDVMRHHGLTPAP